MKQRSDSREGGSASAGSVASAADDEGSPSASGFEGDVDEVNANGFASNASSKQSYVVVESTSSGEKEHADEKNDIGYASEHSVCSSVSSQTGKHSTHLFCYILLIFVESRHIMY